jgi:hypothetical protein
MPTCNIHVLDIGSLKASLDSLAVFADTLKDLRELVFLDEMYILTLRSTLKAAYERSLERTVRARKNFPH